MFRSPQRARARLGNNVLAGDGVASQAVTPQGSPSSPAPRPVIQHLPPRRVVWRGLATQNFPVPVTPYRGRPFVFRPPLPARARAGSNLAAAAGIASSSVTPQGSLGPPHPFVWRSPAPARGRLGNNLGCGDGLASSTVTPQGSIGPPHPFVARKGPQRASVGPRSRPHGGITSAAVTPQGAPSRPKPFIFRSPAPARARLGNNLQPGDGYASRISTPQGALSSPAPRPVLQHVPPHRAVWRGLAAANVIRQGIAGPPRPFIFRPPLRARARLGSSLQSGDGIASSTVTPSGFPQPTVPIVEFRPAASRVLWQGRAVSRAAAVTTAVQQPPAPVRRAVPGRALWRGFASRMVTPQGSPGPPRPFVWRSPLPARAGSGSAARPPPGTRPPWSPRWVTRSPAPRPVLQHVPPHRVLWRGYASTSITRQGAAGPPRPFVWRSPLPARARLGSRLLPAPVLRLRTSPR